jgi:hypothetical protein
VTDHRGPLPVPARITMALDANAAEGPWVDEALGGVEPMVDMWEAGELVPTRHQIELLAKLTGFDVEFFYLPVDNLFGTPDRPARTFLCQMGRRGDNGLTIIDSWTDWAGVLHRKQITPDRPPYRPGKTATLPPAVSATAAARPARAGTHDPVEDPNAPGCCQVCHLPLDRPNTRHTRTRS